MTQPAPVPVRLEDGTLGTAPPSAVPGILKGGGSLATPEEMHQAELDAKYGGVGGMAETAGLGALSGATFGGSDAAAAALGYGKQVREHYEANPNLATGSKLAGMVIPGLLTGGAGAAAEGAEGASLLGSAARAASAIPRGVSALGEGAGSLARGALGEGLLGRTAAGALGTGVETGLMGAGNALSEASLGDPDHMAEKVMSGLGEGFLGGIVLGSAGSLLSHALGKAVDKGAELALGKATLPEFLERKANDMAWRAAGGTQAMARGADRFAGGTDAVASIWRDEVPAILGKKSWAQVSREGLVEAAPKGLEKFSKELDDRVGALDAAAKPHELPRVKDVVDAIRMNVLDPLEARAGTGAAAGKIRSFIDDMARITKAVEPDGTISDSARMTLKQLRGFRVDADKIWAGNSVDPSLMGFKAEFHKARNVMEDQLIAAGDRIAERAGGKFSEGYTDAKQKYQAFKLLEKAAGRGAAAEANNRLLSLTDHIVGGVAASIGHAVGGPAGAALLGGGATLANKFMRERWNFVAPAFLSSAATLGTIQRIGAGVDRSVAKSLERFVAPRARYAESAATSEALKPRKGETRAAAYLRTANAIQSVAAQPERLQTHVAALVDPFAKHAPKLAAATTLTAMQDVQFLASKIPKPRGVDPFDPQQKFATVRAPSHSEISDFDEYLKAYEDPTNVLREMKGGRISREGVEFLKVRRPMMYAEIQSNLDAMLNSSKAPAIDYEQKKQLAILFDRPTDATLTPEFIMVSQQHFAQNNQAPEPPNPSGPSGPGEAQSEMTGAQKVEAGQ